MELQPHPSSVPLSAPLACNADRTLRNRTFCSRRGRATVNPNPLFLASQEYPQQLNWCDTERNVTSSASSWWMPEVQKSCVMWIPPAMPHAWRKLYSHIKNANEKRLVFPQALFLPQTSVFSHFSHHNKILQGRQRWQLSPQGTSVCHWMAIYLKVQ